MWSFFSSNTTEEKDRRRSSASSIEQSTETQRHRGSAVESSHTPRTFPSPVEITPHSRSNSVSAPASSFPGISSFIRPRGHSMDIQNTGTNTFVQSPNINSLPPHRRRPSKTKAKKPTPELRYSIMGFDSYAIMADSHAKDKQAKRTGK